MLSPSWILHTRPLTWQKHHKRVSAPSSCWLFLNCLSEAVTHSLGLKAFTHPSALPGDELVIFSLDAGSAASVVVLLLKVRVILELLRCLGKTNKQRLDLYNLSWAAIIISNEVVCPACVIVQWFVQHTKRNTCSPQWHVSNLVKLKGWQWVVGQWRNTLVTLAGDDCWHWRWPSVDEASLRLIVRHWGFTLTVH